MLDKARTRNRAEGRTRDPDATRELLLHCAFDEIYEHGYSRASLDRILANCGVTKGALYHHFASKADLALAVIDEVIRPFVIERWVAPLSETDDPISALRDNASEVIGNFTDREIACGCPLNNLAQELATADERFRLHLARVFDAWREGLADALARGQVAGNLRADVDAKAAAAFIVASFEGLATTMKSSRDRELMGAATMMFIEFLESLRPEGAPPAAVPAA